MYTYTQPNTHTNILGKHTYLSHSHLFTSLNIDPPSSPSFLRNNGHSLTLCGILSILMTWSYSTPNVLDSIVLWPTAHIQCCCGERRFIIFSFGVMTYSHVRPHRGQGSNEDLCASESQTFANDSDLHM